MLDKDDLKQNLDKLKEKSSKVNQNFLAIGLALLFLAAFIFTAYNSSNKTAEYEMTVAENEQIIAKLKDEIGELDTKKTLDEQTVKQKLNSASEKGIDVANLQNAYRNWDVTKMANEIQANAEKLDMFFSASSKNARTPWYLVTTPTFQYEWRFMSTYSFASDKVDVIWLATDNSGNIGKYIYAYALGQYDVEQGVFTNMKWRMTTLGASYVRATETEFEPISPEKINKMVNDLNSIEVESREQSDEELQRIREAQDKLREIEMEKQKKKN